MAGITRIVITNQPRGAGAYRFIEAKKRQPAANSLYREIFKRLGCPLQEGYEEILCDLNDIPAAFDRLLGVDVILRFENGMSTTLQEKFLFAEYETVTVEFYDNPEQLIEGDWFDLKANYYFVGYDRDGDNKFNDWILVSWSILQRLTARGVVLWSVKNNTRDAARANFKHTYIPELPKSCIIAVRYANGEEYYINDTQALNNGAKKMIESLEAIIKNSFGIQKDAVNNFLGANNIISLANNSIQISNGLITLLQEQTK